jgi:hypothetical protein
MLQAAICILFLLDDLQIAFFHTRNARAAKIIVKFSDVCWIMFVPTAHCQAERQ